MEYTQKHHSGSAIANLADIVRIDILYREIENVTAPAEIPKN